MILILPVILFIMPLTSGYNYCNNKTHVCDLAKRKHFMCRLEDLAPFQNTKYHAIVPDNQVVRRETLGILNTFRNTFAGGDLMTNENKTFRSAKRMRRLNWDEELAYLARSHASTVSFKHSECRSTLRFPMAGEVLALLPGSKKEKFNVLEIMEKAFNPMFEEYKYVVDPEGLLDGFDPDRDYYVGHFSLLVSDRVSRVGCGIAVGSNCRVGDKVGFCHFLTCHFDYTNVEGSYVYKAGEPASKCSDWNADASKKYSNLCANSGELFPPNKGD
ncbi:antigen 5 like allergen Cul n 1-like isoform X1 [Drosophila takahashii]|uniref:antigen 5 like allergen Cul n 1-like isoform X1 n=1 Tax=Drosophila takahashii TaxID=29030 RepID=UPI0038995B89